MERGELINIQHEYEDSLFNKLHVDIVRYKKICLQENNKYNAKVEDYKIEKDHSIDEYLEKYGELLKAHKLLAFRKEELWAMSKKRIYWELPNETELIYFTVPSKNKHVNLFGNFVDWIKTHKVIIIVTSSLLVLGATAGIVAGVNSMPKEPLCSMTFDNPACSSSSGDFGDMVSNMRCYFYESNNRLSETLDNWYSHVDTQTGMFTCNAFIYSSVKTDFNTHPACNLSIKLSRYCFVDNFTYIELTPPVTYEQENVQDNLTIIDTYPGWAIQNFTIPFKPELIRNIDVKLGAEIRITPFIS